MGEINAQFLAYALVILAGYAARRIGLLNQSDADAISRIIFRLTLPTLVIASLYEVVIASSQLIFCIVAFAAGMLLQIVTYVLFKRDSRDSRILATLCAGGYNVGLFAFPIVGLLWGQTYMPYIVLFDCGNSLIVFGVTYLMAMYSGQDGGKVNKGLMLKKFFSSATLVTYLVMLALRSLGIVLPSFLVKTCQVISQANLPLSLLLIGLSLSFVLNRSEVRLMLRTLSVRYVLGMAMAALILLLPLGLPYGVRTMLAFAVLLPIPAAAMPYAMEFRINTRLTATAISVTMILGFLISWLLFGVLVPAV